MMCGGHSAVKPANDEVTQMVNSLRNQIESHMNAQYEVFEAVSYTSQVVAGTNFVVKVHVGNDQHISAKIFRPLPHAGTELQVSDVHAL